MSTLIPDQRVVHPPVSILIVDDFEDALDIYSVWLTFKGFPVLTARSGEECVTLARTHHPALILMDLRMPGMTGTDALRVLRADARFSKIPIVAFTAHALEDERVKALADGFDEVIPKPCDLDDLVAHIQRLLKQGTSST